MSSHPTARYNLVAASFEFVLHLCLELCVAALDVAACVVAASVVVARE